VRLFEWNGSMLHAKTAVADGRWSRVGLDQPQPLELGHQLGARRVVEDEGFAGAMEAMFRRDLANATEVVLGRRRARRTAPRPRTASAAIGRLASAGAGLKGVVTAAAGGTRRLDAVEARSVALLGLAMMAIAAAITVFPVLLVSPVVIILAWMAVGLLARAWRARRLDAQTSGPRRSARRKPLRQRRRCERPV
jgi:cardiolipin synthase